MKSQLIPIQEDLLLQWLDRMHSNIKASLERAEQTVSADGSNPYSYIKGYATLAVAADDVISTLEVISTFFLHHDDDADAKGVELKSIPTTALRGAA